MGGAILEKIGKEAAEVAAKKAAEDAAKRAAEDAAKKAAEDAAKKAAEDAAKKASEDAAKKAAEDAAKKAAEDAAKKAAEDAAKKAAEDAAKKGAETAAKTSGLRTAGALTRDFTLGASKVISNLPVVGPFLKTIGVGGGLYELGKYIFSSHSGPEKPEGATQIKGPDGKMHDVRPISPEEAKTRKPEDFAKDENGQPAKDANGNPYVYYDPKDPNETHHNFGFVDTAIKWIADIEKNPSIAPFAPYINMGIAALAAGAIGSFFNSTLGLLMGLAVAAFMFFKGNDFIKDRAASIDSHDQWTTKHYFNPSAQGTTQTQTQTPDPNSQQQRTPDPNLQRPTGPALKN